MANARDSFRITEAVRQTEGHTQRPRLPGKYPATPLALVGVAKETLHRHELGAFDIQGQPPNKFTNSGVVRRAYAACPIARGTECTIHRCSAPESGGFWWAVPCLPEQEPANSTGCMNIDTGEYPTPDLSISGLADNPAYPMFNGWANFVNGVHQLTQLDPPTPIIVGGEEIGLVRCDPRVVVQVPNNDTTNTLWPPGPLSISWRTNTTQVALVFHAGFITTIFATDLVRAVASENGANPYPRSNGRLQAEQKYSDWQTPTGHNELANWLSTGTFTLYSTV